MRPKRHALKVLPLALLMTCLVIVLATSQTQSRGLETTIAPTVALQPVILPPKFVGTWKGKGSQVNPAAQWSIFIALTPGSAGSVVGSIAYPSLTCGGELTLSSVNSDAIELLEEITYGKDCAYNGKGKVTLKLTANNALEYKWQLAGVQTTGTGTLTKVGVSQGALMPVK